MGTGHLPAVLAPLAGAISSYFSKLLGKYISFKTKAQKSCIEGMLMSAFLLPSGLPHKFRQAA